MLSHSIAWRHFVYLGNQPDEFFWGEEAAFFFRKSTKYHGTAIHVFFGRFFVPVCWTVCWTGFWTVCWSVCLDRSFLAVFFAELDGGDIREGFWTMLGSINTDEVVCVVGDIV